MDKGHGFLNDKSPSQDCLLADDDDDDGEGEEEEEEGEMGGEEEEGDEERRKRWEKAIGGSFTNQAFEDLDGIKYLSPTNNGNSFAFYFPFFATVLSLLKTRFECPSLYMHSMCLLWFALVG